MQVLRYPQINPLSEHSCVTIGNFDGVHNGHQALISSVVNLASQTGSKSVVVTMQPLPAQYFAGSLAVQLLTPFRLKYQLLKSLGVDVMCVLNFNQYLAAMSAADFYREIIVDGLGSQSVLVGDDFRFGANRSGCFAGLKQLAMADGIDVAQHPTVLSSASGKQRISSTAIRQYLAAGDFLTAKMMLGRDFNVVGRVAHGKKIGRTLGYPTINLELKQGAFPLHGVYVVEIVIADRKYPAVASVGKNPSVGGNAKRIEVYVLNFNQQVYGQWVEVLFYKKLRNEVKFDDLSALTSAIDEDVRLTHEFFAQ